MISKNIIFKTDHTDKLNDEKQNEINRAKANNSMPTAHLPSASSFH